MNRTTSVHRQGGKRRLLYLTLLLLLTGLVQGLAARPAAADFTALAGETFSGGGFQTLASGGCNGVGTSTFNRHKEGVPSPARTRPS